MRFHFSIKLSPNRRQRLFTAHENKEANERLGKVFHLKSVFNVVALTQTNWNWGSNCEIESFNGVEFMRQDVLFTCWVLSLFMAFFDAKPHQSGAVYTFYLVARSTLEILSLCGLFKKATIKHMTTVLKRTKKPKMKWQTTLILLLTSIHVLCRIHFHNAISNCETPHINCMQLFHHAIHSHSWKRTNGLVEFCQCQKYWRWTHVRALSVDWEA